MNITILDNRDVIINSSDNLGTQNENNASIINFSFPESLMNANKKIVFITDDGNYWDLITNNSYKITNAVSKYKNVSVYVWLVDEQNDIDFRSKIWNVSFNKNEEPDDIVPTEEEISGFDTMITQLNQGLEELDEEKIKLRREYEKVEEGLEDLDEALIQVNNVDIDVSKSGNTSTITITNKEGVEKSVQIEDGTDYVITQEDYQAIANVVETDITPLMPTKTSDLVNDSGFIDNTVNNLTNYYNKTTSDGKYALISESGYSLELSINSSTYVITLKLKNKNGTVLSTGTVDLPLETMVVNASYDSLTKEIVLTLQNGNTVRFSVADLVSGLQAEITSSNKLASDLVDDTNQTNKFVTTSEKTTWNAKYVKPSGGIPKTDLSSAVQTSLGKADTAIQATDLTDYVKNTDYATSQKGGTVRIAGAYGFSIDGGGNINPIYLNNYTDYSSKNNNYAISKGTLETVITGKKLETANNKVTSIDENSTNTQYPTAKLLFDQLVEKQAEIDGLVEENSALKKQFPTAHISTTSTQLTDSADDMSIENVKLKGATSQKQYNGYNLCKPIATVTKSDMTLTNNGDGSYTLNGTSTASTSFYITGLNYPAGEYTLAGNNPVANNNTSFYLQAEYSGGTIRRILNETNATTTATITNSITAWSIVIPSGLTLNNFVIKPMLESGSTAHDFEPYVGGQPAPSPAYPQLIHRVTGECNEKVQNRNLLNLDLVNTLVNGVSMSFANGKLLLNGTATAHIDIYLTYSNWNRNATEMQKVLGKKNTTFVMKNSSPTKIANFFKNSNNVYVQDTISTSDNLTVEQAFFRVINGSTFNDEEVELQLEESSTAHDFEPHAEQNAPLSLGNEELYDDDEIQIDYVQKAGYKKVTGARFVKNMGKYIFNGTETFNKNSGDTSNTLFYVANVMQFDLTNGNNSKCNYLTQKTLATLNVNNEEGFFCNTTSSNYVIYINIKTELNTGASVQAKLKELYDNNTPMCFVYPLETPTTTPITDITFLAQLETLINMKTYKDITNIESTGTDLAPVLDCDYYQDMSTIKSDIASIKARLDLLEE